MKENLSETPKKKKSIKKFLLIFCKTLCILGIAGTVIYGLLYFFVVAFPLKRVENAYKKQQKIVQEVLNRTEEPAVLKTNAELQSLTDDEAFALLAELGDNNKIITEFDGSASKFYDSYISEFTSDIKYEQLIGIAEYLRYYCGTSDLTEINMTGAVTDYMCNITAVCLFYKANKAVIDMYDKNYSTYTLIEKHLSLESPLELAGLYDTMIKDTALKNKMRSTGTTINRIIQAEYYRTKMDYESHSLDTSVINGTFFDINARSIDDLIDLRMIACNEFLIDGYYIPMNISELDNTLIDESRLKARELLIKCNKRFNATADGATVTGIEKVLQKFAVPHAHKIADRLIDYNAMELQGFVHSPLKLTQEHISYYTRDFVFWNMMLNNLTFENTTSIGTLISNLNYKTNSICYTIIDGGNPIIPDNELDSLLWATAEQALLSNVYSNCKLTFDEEGNVVAEDTNDALVAAYRNWFEAWNLWGSQYTQ